MVFINSAIWVEYIGCLLVYVIDYSFMCLHLISESDLSKLQAVQNNAIRLDGLSDRYIAISLHNNEFLSLWQRSAGEALTSEMRKERFHSVKAITFWRNISFSEKLWE